MLTYDIDKKGDRPIYIYLYDCIKYDIERGYIKANEKLPSKRNFAEHLCVSVMTIQNAYALLLSEGYIYSREKRGYFASELEKKPASQPSIDKIQIEQEKDPTYFVDFCEDSISVQSFPFSVWSRQMREVLSENPDELLARMPNQGVVFLRKAIADFLYSFRGMNVSPEQIIIGAGTEYMYSLLLKLLGKDSVYAVEDPGYNKISAIYESENANFRYISLDSNGISMDEVRKSDADILHISPSHHFPTGIVTSIKRRQELLAWANEDKNRYIIEDDYDSEFRFLGKAIPTLQSIDYNEKVIYINTFSKTLSPALRISYAILPQHLIENYKNKLGFYYCTVSSFEQYTLAKFISKGYFESHINRMRKAYKIKRDTLINVITTGPLSEKSAIFEENSGLHFILKLKTELSDEELVSKARLVGIKISCLSQYCHNRENAEKAVVLINYSGVNTKIIPRAMELLAAIIN